jgi:serine/threonine protein kinase
MELLKRVGQKGELLPERSVWKYFIQITLGLGHIHARNILHRDVKVIESADTDGKQVGNGGSNVSLEIPMCCCGAEMNDETALSFTSQ